LSRADSTHMKNRVLEDLIRHKNLGKRHLISDAQLRYYSNWYYPLIRELVASGATDVETIQKKMRWQIDEAKIKTAIEDLKNLGFIETTPELMSVNSEVVATSPEPNSLEIKLFQKIMIEKAMDALSSTDRHERDIRSATLSIDSSRLPDLKRFVHAMLGHIIETFEAKAEKKNSVIQFNVQTFYLTKLNES